MMIPDSDARIKVIKRIGHDPTSDPISGLVVRLVMLMKNATPGDSTKDKILGE